MNTPAALFQKRLAVTIGIALPLLLSAFGTFVPAAAQDRYWADRELIPPLRLVEEDFKKGFSRTYQFPRDCWPAISGRDRCEGTISLNYAPGKIPDAVHAVINFRYVYYCYGCGKDGHDTGPYYYSVNLSDDLEATGDDPEGKFPAARYMQFGGDFRPVIRTNDPEWSVVPGSEWAFVDIILLQDIGDTIDRTTYARIRFRTELRGGSSINLWSFEGTYGPPSSEGTEEDKSLTLEGCTDLLKGGKGQLTAKAKSGGGKYKWSTDSGSVLSVSGSGASTSVSAKSTGRTVVRVEYETKDGEKIQAEKAGSVVELRSVAPVPQIARIDENGQELPPIQVSVVQDPPDGDLLTFAVADPGVATVENLGSSLLIQGLREGTTTAQAQTVCGEKTGPILKLDVVRCDEKTVQKLREEQRMIKARLDSNRRITSELTGDEEFDRAAREVEDDTWDAAKSTAELISVTMGVAGKAGKAVQVSKGAEKADSIWGLFNTMNTFATGMAEGDMGKVSDAALDATIQVLDLTLAGAARTAYAAGSAARKLARDLGTLGGTADRLKELEDQRKLTDKELEDVDRRLYKVCGEKGSPKTEPPTPQPGPPAKPGPAPQPPPTSKPTPSKPGPPQAQSQPPAAPGGGKAPTEPGGDKPQPPVPPPTPPARGAGGLPMDCACNQWNRTTWGSRSTGLVRLAADLRGTGPCLETFQSGLLAGFQKDVDLLSSALKDLARAPALPQPEMRAKSSEFLTKTDGLQARFEKFAGEAALFHSSLEGCGQGGKQAGELIRKGSAETAAEMIRK